ncbi:MAG: glycosyl hydrolase family 28-related protein [Eubacteriales bacterium]
MKISVSVKDFGAAGNGLQDDSAAFQLALDGGSANVHIPYGNYKIGKTLKVGSNTKIAASQGAVIFLADGACTTVNDFLLTNKDYQNGNVNIAVEGGIWNGNNKGNLRNSDIFDQKGYTGVMINFINVKGLSLINMKLRDSESYFVRLGEIDDFKIDRIAFEAAHLRPNQDGIHLAGYCSNGTIENITATMTGSTNDDMIALNADDEINRLVNLGMKRGPIQNIKVRNIVAEDCHTFVRLLSVHSKISDVNIENVSGGCRVFAINMDAARYCRTPLFKEIDEPLGVGNVENVTISNLTVHKTTDSKNPLIFVETNSNNFKITNFKRERDKEPKNTVSTFAAGKMKPVMLSIDGKSKLLAHNERIEADDNCYKEILFNTLKG